MLAALITAILQMQNSFSILSYPYGNLDLDVNHNQFAMLYDMYANFQNSYYGKYSEPMLKMSQYLTYAPLIVIDC